MTAECVESEAAGLGASIAFSRCRRPGSTILSTIGQILAATAALPHWQLEYPAILTSHFKVIHHGSSGLYDKHNLEVFHSVHGVQMW